LNGKLLTPDTHALPPALAQAAGPFAAPASVPLAAPLSTETLARIVHSSLGTVVSVIDHDTRLHYVNELFAKSFNVTPAEMIGKTLLDLYGEEHSRAFMPYVRRALAGESVTYDRLGVMVGRAGVWFTVAVNPLRDEQGKVVGAVSSSMRVHELKVAVEALRAANERLSSHIDNSPLTAIELDEQLQITHCSSQIHDLLGFDADALNGQSLQTMLGSDEALQPLWRAFERLQSGQETRNRVDVAITHQSGKTVYCEWFNSALTDATGKVSSMMSLVQNTTARTLAEAQLLQIATHDPLTGLRNRRALTERLGQAVQRAKRYGSTVALLFIDLDGFKRVNDVYGHGAGDEVLCEVARRLLSETRQTDVVARLGGDEFVMLTETEVTVASMNTMCDRIMRALSVSCRFEGGEATIGASVGIALCPHAADDAVELMRAADAAMYEAKRAGKGRVCFAPHSMQIDLQRSAAD
jgi:diguanylate cyclase (GGDEF)-like protein/PAS domain S-box-containing protein